MKPDKQRYMLILALMVALAASLTTNIFYFQRSQYFATAYRQVILDPMGMDHYLPRDNPKLPQEKELVVFLGDSRAYYWPAPASTDRFVFANRGVNGQSSAQVLGRFADDVVPLHPDIILIQVGINDLTGIPYFPSRRARIIADCKENIRVLTEQALELDATVILTTMFPVTKGLFPWERSDAADINGAVEEVNQFIQSLAGEHVIVMDTGKILAGPDEFTKAEYSEDMLHLNEQGYQVLNESLSKILEDMTKGMR